MRDVLGLSAVRQARLVRSGEISPAELIQAHLEQIARVNPAINAAVEVLAERALAEARTAPPGPLQGVPFSVKDSIGLAGSPCTGGTLGRARAAPCVEDAAVVARLRAAGAIPIARTNLPDLLFAFESENLIFGATNNPYDLSRTSGGSSGGEAALIAACGSPLGLGSDAAGSVRVPAAFCGIASIKPTSGRLPRTGHFPPAGGWIEAIWQIGPMARYVEDLVAVMPLLAGSDGRDPTVADVPLLDPGEVTLRGLRVAFYTENGVARTDSEVAEVVRAAAHALMDDVLAVDEVRPACLDRAYDLEMKLLGADGGDFLRNALRECGSASAHPLLRAWLDKLEPYRTDLAGFQKYWDEWDRYRADMLAFFRNYDAILCPAYTQPALPHGASIIDTNFRGFSHTMAYNLTGWPAVVVRCGQSTAGLPIAVQIVAHRFYGDVALAVAGWLEQAFGGWRPPALSG